VYQYFIWFVNLIGMWHSKAVVFVKYYSLNVYLFLPSNPIFSESFGQRNGEMIKC